MIPHGWSLRILCSWKKPYREGKILCESTYLRYVEQAHSQWIKGYLLRVDKKGGRTNYYLMGSKFWLYMMKKSWIQMDRSDCYMTL